MKRLLRAEKIRFLLVGSVNTAASYGLYALLVWLGVGFVAAHFTATLLGIAFSFRTLGRFVFGNTDQSRILRYVVVWLLLWLFNVGLIWLLTQVGANAYAAGAIALVPTVLLSYVVQKLVVFRASPPGVTDPAPMESAR